MISGWLGLGSETEVEDVMLPVPHYAEFMIGPGEIELGATLLPGGEVVARTFAEVEVKAGYHFIGPLAQFVVRLQQNGTFAAVLADRVTPPSAWDRCGPNPESPWSNC